MQSRIIGKGKLPFELLSSQEFEELVLWVLLEEHTPLSSHKMGRKGDPQHGKDLVLVFDEYSYAIECKRYKTIYPGDVKKIFKKFSGNYKKKFLVTSAVVSSGARNILERDEIIIDGDDLSRKLKTHWSLVACFFGTEIANIFCASDTSLSRCLEHIGQDHYFKVINKTLTELDTCPDNNFYNILKNEPPPHRNSFPVYLRPYFDVEHKETIFSESIDIFFPYHYCATLVIFSFLKVELNLNISINFLERTSKAIPLILSSKGINIAIALSRTQLNNLHKQKSKSGSIFYTIANLPYGTHELYLKNFEKKTSTSIITLDNSSQWNELQKTTNRFLKGLNAKLVPEKPTESKFLNALEMDMGIISPWSFLWASNQTEIATIRYCITERFLVSNLSSKRADILGRLFYLAWLYLAENRHLVPSIILKNFPFKEIIQFCNLSKSEGN